MRLFLLGVPVGWFAAAVLVPVLIVGSLALILLRGADRFRQDAARLGQGFTAAIREVSDAGQ